MIGPSKRQAYQKMSADLKRAFGRSPFLTYWITRALVRRVKSHFASVRWSGQKPSFPASKGILFYSNHPSWWDPALFATLQAHFMKTRAGFGPIDAETLKRYPFLGRAGFLPLDPTSHRSIRQLLTASARILQNGGIFWLTAQGSFTDSRCRPIRLRPGIAHIAQTSPGAVIIPVALDYCFGAESRADVFIRFGQPIDPACIRLNRVELRHALEHALETTQDHLADDVASRRWSAFESLVDGNAGMGGLYALSQRVVTLARRKRYEPHHARR